jgi:hypothetical protein
VQAGASEQRQVLLSAKFRQRGTWTGRKTNKRKVYKMKSIMTKLGLAAGITLCAASVLASGNPTASGHGNLRISDYDYELRTFSFTAVQHKDGSVTGEAQLVNRFQDRHLHITINCMVITPLPDLGPGVNAAVVSGTVDVDSLGVWTGWDAVFAVVDTGEGKNVLYGGDYISLVYLFDPTTSPVIDYNWYDYGYYLIDAGNIQVLP